MSDSESTSATNDRPIDEKVEHPFLEAFGAEGVVENPGELPDENEDPADEADAPAP